ncbi:MAG: uncharacterized protein JWO10_906, partial [Microbacteriaceae bacterium]|nr:uncharacterized protein [Microbacteriaceae bacterium]
TCVTAETGGNDVTLRGSDQQPGTSGEADSPSRSTLPRARPTKPRDCSRGGDGCPALRDNYTVSDEDTGSVTLVDVASFAPDASVDRMEPNGWTVIGLDTNFFSDGGVLVREGLLLGHPASVRFTAQRFRWAYGDGLNASYRDGGSTWAAQGIAEFDQTSTSHIFRAAGTFRIDLTVDYSAEYRYATGAWSRISGTLSIPANQLVVSVGDANTVLVGRECGVRHTDPGC